MNWMILACVVGVGCAGASSHHDSPANHANGQPAQGELKLSVAAGCDGATAPTTPLVAGESVQVVTCSDPEVPGDAWRVRAYLVHRMTPTTGSEALLSEWMQSHESSEHWDIAGVARDQAKQVTRVVVLGRRSGLDEPVVQHVKVYDPSRRTWTGQELEADSATVENAADGAATIKTCTLPKGVEATGTCEETPGHVVSAVPVT